MFQRKKELELVAGDMSRTFIPLDENHSYDAGEKGGVKNGDKKVTKKLQMQRDKIACFYDKE